MSSSSFETTEDLNLLRRNRKRVDNPTRSHSSNSSALSPSQQKHNWRKYLPFIFIFSLFLNLYFLFGRIREDAAPAFEALLDLPSGLIVSGHQRPDCDTVFSAIGLSHLLSGTPALPEGTVNNEINYCIEHFRIKLPEPVETFINRGNSWILVDHSSSNVKSKKINTDEVVAVLDHHRLGDDSFDFQTPVYIDTRPWGSVSTIVALMFRNSKRSLTPQIAQALACGVISDTLNLRSGTTTPHDREALSFLSPYVPEGTDQLAQNMFRAKSDVSKLSVKEIIMLDFKSYEIAGKKIGWGCAETIDPQVYGSQIDKYLEEMRKIKEAESLTYIFFSTTDISVRLNRAESKLIVEDTALGLKMFPFATKIKDHFLDVGIKGSRKQDFIPAVKAFLKTS